MKYQLVFVWLTVLISGRMVFSAEQPKVDGHQTKLIEGWTIIISDKLIKDDEVAADRALELLTMQLKEIVQNVPTSVVVELRKVPLWFSPEYEGVPPRAE